MLKVFLTPISPSVEVINKVLLQLRHTLIASDISGTTLERYRQAFDGVDADEQVVIQIIAVGITSSFDRLATVIQRPGLRVDDAVRFYQISLAELMARLSLYTDDVYFEEIVQALSDQLKLLR